MKTAGTTAHALLGLLTFHPMSGYDMRRLIPESIGHFWSESYGQIYPALNLLSAQGLVERSTKQAKGRPERNVFSLTEAGRRHLEQWLAVPLAPPVPRNELLLKLFFGAHADLSVSRAHVEAHRKAHQAALDQYLAIAKKLQEEYRQDLQLPFWLMTLSYGRHSCSATIAWCDETLQQLDHMQQAPA